MPTNKAVNKNDFTTFKQTHYKWPSDNGHSKSDQADISRPKELARSNCCDYNEHNHSCIRKKRSKNGYKHSLLLSQHALKKKRACF